jgi:hypothetical protein
VHVRRQDLARSDVTHVGVLPATVPLRTAIDIAASEDEVAAVVAIDSGLRMRQFTVEAVRAELRGRRHLPTRPKAEVVIGLVDPTSGSVPESMARVLFGRAGLPTPVPQFPIRLGNGRIAYADFAWPEHRLVVEIDGFAWHSSNEALQRDHSRQNQLQLAGWTILRYTAKDIRQRMPSVLDEVRQALGR